MTLDECTRLEQNNIGVRSVLHTRITLALIEVAKAAKQVTVAEDVSAAEFFVAMQQLHGALAALDKELEG